MVPEGSDFEYFTTCSLGNGAYLSSSSLSAMLITCMPLQGQHLPYPNCSMFQQKLCLILQERLRWYQSKMHQASSQFIVTSCEEAKPKQTDLSYSTGGFVMLGF